MQCNKIIQYIGLTFLILPIQHIFHNKIFKKCMKRLIYKYDNKNKKNS